LANINIFSAGAAQSVVAGLAPDFQAKHDCEMAVPGSFAQTLPPPRLGVC